MLTTEQKISIIESMIEQLKTHTSFMCVMLESRIIDIALSKENKNMIFYLSENTEETINCFMPEFFELAIEKGLYVPNNSYKVFSFQNVINSKIFCSVRIEFLKQLIELIKSKP